LFRIYFQRTFSNQTQALDENIGIVNFNINTFIDPFQTTNTSFGIIPVFICSIISIKSGVVYEFPGYAAMTVQENIGLVKPREFDP
jgi:hypothetical protein